MTDTWADIGTQAMTQAEITEAVIQNADTTSPTWMDEIALLRAHCRELAARLDAPEWRTDVENAPKDEWLLLSYENDPCPYWIGKYTDDGWLDVDEWDSNPPDIWMPIPTLPETNT